MKLKVVLGSVFHLVFSKNLALWPNLLPVSAPSRPQLTDHECDAGGLVAVEALRDGVIERLHHVEVDGGSGARHRQGQAEHHVQLLALVPLDGVRVDGHAETLAADTAGSGGDAH